MRDNQTQLPLVIGCGIGCMVLMVVGAAAAVLFLSVGFFTTSSSPVVGRPMPAPAADSRFVMALPSSATDIQSESVDMFTEYFYYLKANISEAEFNTFTTTVDVTPHTPDRDYSDDIVWLSWPAPGGQTPGWWDASQDLDGTYVRQSGGDWVLVKYEGGYVYVYAFGH